VDTSLLSRDPPERQLRHATAELQRQLSAGQATLAEDWLQKLPAVATDEELALELIYGEYVVRESLGQQPKPEEYYTRFPALKERLQRLFKVDALLQKGEELQKTALDIDAVGNGSSNVHSPTLCKEELPTRANALLPAMGDFQPLDRLGSGGMGVVYRARQLSLQRFVALKIIREDIACEADVRARFLREARIVARLEHPHIVRIHEAGEYEGRLFLALEYVGGGTLRTFLQGKPLPPRDAAQLVETLARSMHFAHQRDVIHRDLKPANILLHITKEDCRLQNEGQTLITFDTRHSALGIPKITDFGLAVHLSGQGQLTSLGRVVGTPCYMAPEQAAGREGWITPLVDVYALGVILYETLVGRPPFMSDSDLETLRLVTQEDAVPPSRLQPKLPRDLEIICMKCLEKEPQKRYLSAEELADDLQRFLRQEPIHARPARWWESVGRWMRRHPARTALVLVCVLALTLLGVVVGIYTHWLENALAESDRQRQLAQDHAAKAKAAAKAEGKRRHQARQALDAMTSQVVEDWLLTRPALEPAQREFLEQALQQYEAFAEETGADEEGRSGVAGAYLRVANINLLLGRPDRAELAVNRAIDLLAGLRRDFPDREQHRRLHAVALHRRAVSREALGAWTGSDQDFQAAAREWQALVDDFPQNRSFQVHLATVYTNHSVLLQRQGRWDEGLQSSQKSLALWDRYLKPSPRNVAGLRGRGQALCLLGSAQRRLKHAGAVDTYRQAFALTEQVSGHDPASCEFRSEHASCHLELALVLADASKHAEAEPLLQKGLVLYNRLVDDRPNVASYRHSRAKLRSVLGQELVKLRRLPEAETAHREALKEMEQLQEKHPKEPEFQTSVAGCLVDLGDLLRLRNRHRQALECYVRAEAILTKQLEVEPRHESARRFLLQAYRGLGQSLEKESRPVDEAAMWLRAQTFMEEPYRTSCVIEQALALCRADKRDEAAALADAIPAQRLTALSRFYLASVYARLAAVDDVVLREKHAARVEALLMVPETRAILQQSRFAEDLRQRKTWDALRERDWFQRLLAEGN
jgi:tetratricopeptide (TPR) repeat protein